LDGTLSQGTDTMTDKIDVSLLSRNEIAREGLRRILLSDQFDVQSSATDAASLTGPAPSDGKCRPHIIIIDDAPGSDPIGSCRELSERYPNARLVLLADDYEFDEVALAFGCGIDGYIVKEISCEPLIESLKLVALGEKVLPSQLARNLSFVSAGSSGGDWHESVASVGLSDREVEILRCLTMGLANKVVSRRLSISEATVKVHVKAILRKLRVANRTQAAIWAIKHGFERVPYNDGSAQAATAEEPVLSTANEEILEYAE
jgi:two-component system, NarL family, nitrate/nitrite response regulator NarL